MVGMNGVNRTGGCRTGKARVCAPCLLWFLFLFAVSCSLFPVPSHAGIWYVNDTSTAGDSYTTAAGNNSNAGSAAAPFRDISKAMAVAAAGDTIYIDAGIFDSYVVISALETAGIKIDTDNITLIGKDSMSTIIDPPGAPTDVNVYGVYADTQTGLLIKNLAVNGAYEGIHFENVDQSTVTGDSVCYNGDLGIYLVNGSDSNIVTGNAASFISGSGMNQIGILLYTNSNNNTVTNNTTNSDLNYGIQVWSSNGNSVANNTANSNAYGIYLYSNSNNNTVSGNTANSNSSYGVCLQSSSFDTVSNNTTDTNTSYGIYLYTSANNNVVSGNAASANSYGIFLSTTCDSNAISNNTVTSNTSYGISVANSQYNKVAGNVVTSNNSGIDLEGNNNTVDGNVVTSNIYGVYVQSPAAANRVIHNLVRSNTNTGVYVTSSSNNVFAQNRIDSNAGYQISLNVTSSSDTFFKNNITPSPSNPDSAVFKAAAAGGGAAGKFSFVRNWWGAADESKIKAMIFQASNGDSIIWSPYRLGLVDTTAGNDTTPPAPPVGVTADTSVFGKITLTWTIPAVNEETNGLGVAFNGARIYRLKNLADTTYWSNPSNLVHAGGTSTETTWTDTDVAGGSTYYYRLTSRDAALYTNESFFTDTLTVVPAPYAGPNWYVNDALSTLGDSFTYATGSDVTGDGSRQTPFASIPKAISAAAAGDTIWIDAGVYDSYVTVNGTETAGVNIDKDSMTLIGKDSNATVIDPPGANTVSGLYGIYADTQVGLTIKNIGVTGAYEGIYWANVDSSSLLSDSASSCGNNGIVLSSGSESNALTNLIVRSNTKSGLVLEAGSNGNVLTGITAIGNAGTVAGGIYLDASWNNVITGNNASSNPGAAGAGILLTAVSCNNIVSNNTANSNANNGIKIYGDTNTVSGNTVNSNIYGIDLTSSFNNTVSNNTLSSNSNGAFYLNGCSLNVITANAATANGIGMTLDQQASNNTVSNNLFASNTLYGVYLWGVGNRIAQNRFYSNTQYQVYIAGSASSDTIVKNNFYTSAPNPDSGVYNSSGATHEFTRNWWGVADSQAIKNKISETSAVNLIRFSPFRLDVVDTTAGADTVAPLAPDTVAVLPSDTSLIVSWASVTANEDGVGGPPGASGGYTIWRSETKDTSSWIKIGSVTFAGVQTWFQDTNVAVGHVYYYRVTCWDGATPFGNESFYSDSQPFDSAPFSLQANWYVNDAWTASDSFTIVSGSDTSGNGSKTFPFRTIPMAMRFATAGDTIYIDAGVYDSYVTVNGNETAGVNIDKDSVTLIGADSNATVIDPPGPAALPGLYAVYADNQYNLSIRNIGARGAQCGLMLVNIDQSTLSGDSLTGNGNHGIILLTGSDSNTVSNNVASFNTSYGIEIDNSAGNTLSGNTVNSNTDNGIYLLTSSGNTISGNTVNSNATDGIEIQQASNNNTLIGNTANSNGEVGIFINTSSNNIVRLNTTISNQAGIWIDTGSGNLVSHNTATANFAAGIGLDNSDTNRVRGNEIRGNDTGICIYGASRSNYISRNNVSNNNLNNFYNKSGLAQQTLARNWWGSADGAVIALKFSDTASSYLPYRLAQADTAAGADTSAPYIFDTSVALTAGNTAVTLTWDTPTQDEDSNILTGFGGVTIYRLTVPDTTNWTAAQIANVSAGVNSYVDAGLTNGTTYYYRLTASDTASVASASWFTDTKSVTPSIDTTAPNIWYVNDTSLSGDLYTTAVGADTQTGLSANAPFRTITRALKYAGLYDTLYIDAGTYTETVVIDTDTIALIGKDSAATVINPGNDLASDSVRGIRADTRTGLLIRDLGVQTCLIGIQWSGVVNSRIQNVTVQLTSLGGFPDPDGAGIILQNGSDTNTLTNNTVQSNQGTGIWLVSSRGNTISGNLATSNGNGIVLTTSDSNVLSGNTASSNTPGDGIALSSSSFNTLTGNAAYSNSNDGIRLTGSSNGNTVSNNTATGNTASGFDVDGSTGDTLSNNTSTYNANGFYLGTAVANAFSNNVSSNNALSGFNLNSGSIRNSLSGNRSANNAQYGVYLYQSDSNSLTGNVISQNSLDGVRFQWGAQFNRLCQNTVDSNAGWAVSIAGPSPSNVFVKNNIRGSDIRPDSGVKNITGYAFDFTRNWWATSDSVAIRNKIYDTAAATGIKFQPYRLGVVDTSAGVDTVAPRAPDTVSATSGDPFILVSWSAVTANEDTDAGPVSLPSYTVYRSEVVDTSSWIKIGSTASAFFQDTWISPTHVYYYRVTASDTAQPFKNESFYSDSQPSGQLIFVDDGSKTVYVSDRGDSSYPTIDSTASAFSSVMEAMDALDPSNGYDTIIIFSPYYSDSYAIADTEANIETGLAFISKKTYSGADTGGGGDSFPTFHFYNPGLALRVLRSARLEGVRMDGGSNESGGVVGMEIAESVILRGCVIQNVETGVHYISGTSGLRIEGCTITGLAVGVELTGRSALVANSQIVNNSRYGILMDGSSGGNLIRDNTIAGNGRGIALLSTGANQTILRNQILNNTWDGIEIASSSSIVNANDIMGNDTGVSIEGGAFGQIRWNNIYGNTSQQLDNAVSGQTITRNYWGSADVAVLSAGQINSSFDPFAPFRFALIDTRASGDSVALDTVTGLTAGTATPNQIALTWVAPSKDEDGSAPDAVSLYKIFRRANEPDTSNWMNALYATAASAGYADTDVLPGNTYYYRVSAVDASGITGWPADTISVIPTFSGVGSVRLIDAGGTAKTLFKLGDSVVVEVNDSDPNTNPAAVNTAQCTVVNLTRGDDTVVLVLRESGVNSAMFRETVALSTSILSLSDSILHVSVGDVIQVSYNDSVGIRQSTATVIPAGISAANANLTLTVDHLLGAAGTQLDTDFVVTVKDTQGNPVYGASVDFSVDFAPSGATGQTLSVMTGASTGFNGQAATRLTLGNLNDVYIVKVRVNGALDSYFTAYSDGVDAPQNKWVMWAPVRGPVTPANLSGASNMIFYHWEPDIDPNSNGEFDRYASVSGQAGPNAAPNTFSAFEVDEAYWVLNKNASASFRPIAGSVTSDTGSYELVADDVTTASPWVQAGNPFPFWIDWTQDVRIETDATGAVYTLAEADTSGFVDDVVYWFDEDLGNYVWGPKASPQTVMLNGATAAGASSVQLKPGAGFWVRVTSNTPCTFVISPSKRTVLPTSSVILNQAPHYLSAIYKEQGLKATESAWEIQLMAGAGDKRDVMNYVGVMKDGGQAERAGRYDPPSPAGSFVTLSVRRPDENGRPGPAMAASYAPAPPDASKVLSWPVEVKTDLAGRPVTVSWDNIQNLPVGYGAYLRTPEGQMIDMGKQSSTTFASSPRGVTTNAYTLYVGSAEALAAVMSAPLSKDISFAYPNPGPDGTTGLMTFKYNLQSPAEVKLRIFDVGGRLVKELSGTGIAGSNTILWDTTDKHGQKSGSGVYIYILESGGNKLVDKLSIVR